MAAIRLDRPCIETEAQADAAPTMCPQGCFWRQCVHCRRELTPHAMTCQVLACHTRICWVCEAAGLIVCGKSVSVHQ